MNGQFSPCCIAYRKEQKTYVTLKNSITLPKVIGMSGFERQGIRVHHGDLMEI